MTLNSALQLTISISLSRDEDPGRIMSLKRHYRQRPQCGSLVTPPKVLPRLHRSRYMASIVLLEDSKELIEKTEVTFLTSKACLFYKGK